MDRWLAWANLLIFFLNSLTWATQNWTGVHSPNSDLISDKNHSRDPKLLRNFHSSYLPVKNSLDIMKKNSALPKLAMTRFWILKFFFLEMGESEKLGLNSFLFLVTLLLWPLLFSGSTLFFSERQKDSLIALGKVKASLWRLGLLKKYELLTLTPWKSWGLSWG